MKSKRISTKAELAILHGSRPISMWTRIAILTQIKRLMPHDEFELAKQLETDKLLESISPIVQSYHYWRDGELVAFHVFSPFRFFLATGRQELAKQYKRTHNGMEFSSEEAFKGNSF